MSEIRRARCCARPLTAVLLSLALSTAGAQQDDALARLQPSPRRQVQAILDSARQSQLPVAPIRFKVAEGVNKHLDEQHIVEVAHSVFLSLRDARAVLGPVDDEKVIIGAGALTGAMKPDVLLRERGATKGHSITWAFSVLADLVHLGVPHPQATAAVAKLWRAGTTDDQMYALWSSVAGDVRGGANPAEALRTRLRSFTNRR